MWTLESAAPINDVTLSTTADVVITPQTTITTPTPTPKSPLTAFTTSATMASSAGASSQILAPTPAPGSRTNPLSSGTIAGIAVGAAIGGILLAVVVFLALLWRRKARPAKEATSSGESAVFGVPEMPGDDHPRDAPQMKTAPAISVVELPGAGPQHYGRTEIEVSELEGS